MAITYQELHVFNVQVFALLVTVHLFAQDVISVTNLIQLIILVEVYVEMDY